MATKKGPRNFQENQRVGVFVDVQNMFYSAKHQFKAKLNFAKLIETIASDRKLVRAFAYIVQSPDIDQSGFMDMLKRNGFEIRSKDLKVRPDGSTKGDWDMEIALEAISMADKLDVVALVSGDGDFASLVSLLKSRGVKVEVYAFAGSTADELKQVANEFHPLGAEFLLKEHPGHREHRPAPAGPAPKPAPQSSV